MIAVAFSVCENTYKAQHAAALHLRDMLLCCFGIDPKAYVFKKDKQGKPYAVNASFHFSISHSGTLCCCAVSADTSFSNKIASLSADIRLKPDTLNMPQWKWEKNILLFPGISGNIGMDLEKVNFETEMSKLTKIAERYLYNTEKPSDIADFYRKWTRQEAYGKYTGQGFLAKPESDIPLYSFRICHQEDTYFLTLACNIQATIQ